MLEGSLRRQPGRNWRVSPAAPIAQQFFFIASTIGIPLRSLKEGKSAIFLILRDSATIGEHKRAAQSETLRVPDREPGLKPDQSGRLRADSG
jgi:hypothetical protein